MATPVMIYDDACPMCRGYTKAFDRFGWAGRTAFSQLPLALRDRLDLNRARHEIPLYHPDTGRVDYGLDSQLAVLRRGLPLLQTVSRLPVLKYLLKPLYKLITYNRRVIAGTRAPATGFDCAPDYHVGWRLTYILLALSCTILINSLHPILIGFLVAASVPSLLFSTDRLSTLGALVTTALAISLAAIILPYTALAILMGVELHRRLL